MYFDCRSIEQTPIIHSSWEGKERGVQWMGGGFLWTNRDEILLWVTLHPVKAQEAQEMHTCPKARGFQNSNINTVGWNNICHRAWLHFCKLVRLMRLIGLTVQWTALLSTVERPIIVWSVMSVIVTAGRPDVCIHYTYISDERPTIPKQCQWLWGDEMQLSQWEQT
jgi:hypothetical protein